MTKPIAQHTGLRYRDQSFHQLSTSAKRVWKFATARDRSRTTFGHLWRDLTILLRCLRRVPELEIPLSGSAEGEMIRAHLACRRVGIPRFRLAQGVLRLPASSEDYLRGRARQAVRTNVRHAIESGLHAAYEPVPFLAVPATPGMRGDKHLRLRAASEAWSVLTTEGKQVGQAWCTVDRNVALLHTLSAEQPYGRWLLHTAIVESLCGRCDLLITNSFDAPLLSPGDQYFQHLLGYEIYRLQPVERKPRRFWHITDGPPTRPGDHRLLSSRSGSDAAETHTQSVRSV